MQIVDWGALDSRLRGNDVGGCACLWFLARNRRNGPDRSDRDRRGEILFIDARKLGRMVDRTHRELTDGDISRIADAYRAWRSGDNYADERGFCRSASIDDVRKHGYVLTPGRYVGAEPQQGDGEPFAQKMTRLTAQWSDQESDAARLDTDISANLQQLGFIDENPGD